MYVMYHFYNNAFRPKCVLQPFDWTTAVKLLSKTEVDYFK